MSQIFSETIVMRPGDDIVKELTTILEHKQILSKELLILNATFIKKTEFSIVMEIEYQV